MTTPRCTSCPQTASIECMRNCPLQKMKGYDRNRDLRNLLRMTPDRVSMLTAGAPFTKKAQFQQLT